MHIEWPIMDRLKHHPMNLCMAIMQSILGEVQARSRRVRLQNDMSAKVYKNLMIDNLEDLSCLRLHAFGNIEANKLGIAKYYNKKVKIKQFSEETWSRK